MSIGVWIYLWTFYFVPLIYISVFVVVTYCLDDCGFAVEPEVRQVDSSSSILLSQDCFGYSRFFVFPSERKKGKQIKRNEDNLRDLQDNIKCPNIQIIGVPEEDKKKDHEKILEIIVENFPKMGKEIINQVQETQRVPNRIKAR